jgi:uncharacterized protein DUF4038/collagenase-like protein with putative collagen-binding domain
MANKLKTWGKQLSRQEVIGTLVFVVFASIGTILLVASHAATPYASTEAESGTLNGGATTVTDPTASNGSAVKFASTGTSSTPFATAVSSNHHYLVDQSGNPYLVVGDSGWDIGVNLSTSDQDSYISQRAAQGFNTIPLIDIAGQYEDNETTPGLTSPYLAERPDWLTFDGIAPFYQSDGVTMGTGPSNYDVTKPNPAYWARIDNVVQQAQQHGITIWMQPLATAAYQDNPSFFANQGTAKLTTYATWVANRYKSYPNVQWDWGDDYWPSLQPANNQYIVTMANAVKAVLPNSLSTIELNDGTHYQSMSPDLNLSTDDTSFITTGNDATHAQLGLNWMYDCQTNSPDMLRGYNLSNAIPVIFGEGLYEGDNNGKCGVADDAATQRAYFYNPLLTGGDGSFYGNSTVWWNGPGWQSDMDTTAVTQVGYYKTLMSSVNWWTLVPDQTSSFATSGATTAAVSADGSLGMAYLQTGGSVTINMTKMKGSTTAKWFDPTAGTSSTIGTFANTGTHSFTAPAAHSDGADDWLLVLTS